MSDSSIADCGRPLPAIVQQTLELWPKCPPWPKLSREEHAALTAWLQSQPGQLGKLARQAREHKPNPFSFGKWYSLVWEMVMGGWDMRLLKAVQAVEDRLAYEDALRLVRDEDLERAMMPRARSEPAQVSPSSPTLLDGTGEGRELPQGTPAPQSSPARKGEAAAVQPEPKFCFHRDDDGWFIRTFGKKGHFHNLIGFEYIAKLPACRGKLVPMVELIASGDANAAATLRTLATAHVPQSVLDDDAWRNIKRRLEELKADINRAEQNDNFTEAEVLRNEFQRFCEHVKATTTPGGKSTRFSNSTDKMRARIANALRRACEALRKGEMHDLAAHLEASIEAQSDYFTYSPSPQPPWAL